MKAKTTSSLHKEGVFYVYNTCDHPNQEHKCENCGNKLCDECVRHSFLRDDVVMCEACADFEVDMYEAE